jgi:hypothetical protein
MPASLTLADFSDRDLLYALDEASDLDGWATSEQVARQIGIDHPRPNQCVGARLGWLNRYGVMERGTVKGDVVWRLNSKGRELIFGSIRKSSQELWQRLTETERVAAADALALRLDGSSRQAVHLSRRAWRHRFYNWRDPQLGTK